MEPKQRLALRQTFERLVPLPKSFGLAFYGRLFEVAPDLQRLFRGNPERQATMLVNALTLAVLNLLDEGRASRAVHELGARHRDYGVRDEDYDVFGAALEWTFAQRLGDGFGDEFRDAWREAWRDISQVMKAAPAPAEPA